MAKLARALLYDALPHQKAKRHWPSTSLTAPKKHLNLGNSKPKSVYPRNEERRRQLAKHSDPHKRIANVVARKKKVDADLAALLGRTVAEIGPAVAERRLQVSASAGVIATFEARSLLCTLGLNGQVLGHSPSTPFHLALHPGSNFLVAVLVALEDIWAFKIDLLADGSLLDTVADQDNGTGSKPVSPVVWEIVVT